MCGIVGGFGPGADNHDLLRQMAASIRHRGPDHTGCLLEDHAGLIMNRLAIIDLAGGNQPMFSPDGDVALIYNGEIYNFRELRAELEPQFAFHSRSDTEVILNGYRAWGSKVFARLNGIFAVAIYDRRRGKLLLARDSLGVKPLAVLRRGGTIYFSSELKAFSTAGLANRVNPAAVAQFLSAGYVFSPTCSLDGVTQMEAGCVMEIDEDGESRSWRFRDLPARRHLPAASPSEWQERVRGALDRAVIGQTVADVPYGLLLSAGMDSMAILATLHRHGLAEKLRTFTLYYENESFSENSVVTKLAADWGFENAQLRLDGEMVRDALPRLFETYDNLEFLPTCAAIWFISHFASDYTKVLLAGNGGDEIFLGYPTYRATAIARRLGPVAPLIGALAPLARLLPVSDNYLTGGEKIRRFVDGSRHGPERAHVSWRHVFTQEELQSLLRGGYRAGLMDDVYEPQTRHFEEARRLGFTGLDVESWGDLKTWFADNALSMWDKAGMSASVEIRVPLVDPGFLDFVLNVPQSVRGERPGTKAFFRRMFEAELPPEVTRFPKHGFQVPVAEWLRGPLRQTFLDLTMSLPPEVVSRPVVERLWRDFDARRRDNALRLWCLGCLSGWAAKYRLSW